jgi:hypothetical protein
MELKCKLGQFLFRSIMQISELLTKKWENSESISIGSFPFKTLKVEDFVKEMESIINI